VSSPTRPAQPSLRRLTSAYDAVIRTHLTVSPEHADDPEVLLAAIPTLPPSARALLDLLWLVVPPGDPLPERLRTLVERDGDPLWHALLLVPRATWYEGAAIHPLHYAASCRLNPALAGWAPELAPPADPATVATFPQSDAWWEAIVVAAWLESNPAALTQDGVLRKDAEKRLIASFPGDPSRWELALRLARLSSLVRPAGQRLHGSPEAVPRPIADPAALFGEPLHASLATALLRLVGTDWVDWRGLVANLQERCRELVSSPKDGTYADRPEVPFTDAGWVAVEGPGLERVVDALHRTGILDVNRDPSGVTAIRRATPRAALGSGFLLTPDLDLLVHAGDLSLHDYGRLARAAPYVDGERLHRHRLSREGVAADLAHGHLDLVGFLTEHSRTGVPPNVADTIRHWQRSATRITVVTGIDVEEDESGVLRLAPPGALGDRFFDYATPPRGRFVYHRGRVGIIDGWDPLTVRACVNRIARYVGREGDERVYELEVRHHAHPTPLLELLRQWYGGELPGEVEAMVLAGSTEEAIRVERAVVVHLPPALAPALRRDRVAGPLLRRPIGFDQAVVEENDLPLLRSRFAELGLRWADDP
jgi:hypothetical protein